MSKSFFNPKTSKELAEGLSHFLADTMVLYVKTLNFHWNMTGAQFFMYHKLLESQYEELASALDEIAERIRQLNQPAPGSMAEMLSLSCLKEAGARLSQERMVKELVQDHESLAYHCHELIPYCQERKDEGSADLLIKRVQVHDKAAWLLKSHIK